MSDRPRYEANEQQEEMNEAQKTVAAEIDSLDIGLKLERHPQLLERLAETGEHFEDSLEMAKLIRDTYDSIKNKLHLSDEGPERLMRAAVLHDVGKSGPAGAETSFNVAVRRLFDTPKRPFNPFATDQPNTIRAFVEMQQLPDSEDILMTLRENGIDPDREPAIEFWRRHADWGYDILRSEIGEDIDQNLIRIVGSHHILEGKNPAGLDPEHPPTETSDLETLELSGLMAAVDKYQAFRDRSHLGHAETMRRLRAIFDNSPHVDEGLKAKFRLILDVLDETGQRQGRALDRAA